MLPLTDALPFKRNRILLKSHIHSHLYQNFLLLKMLGSLPSSDQWEFCNWSQRRQEQPLAQRLCMWSIKTKNTLHQAAIAQLPTLREGESKLCWWGKHSSSPGPLPFQLTGFSMPSSVSVTGSTESCWEPARSINPQPSSLPTVCSGKAVFPLPTRSLLPKQERSRQG